jgi:hypothetical protein
MGGELVAVVVIGGRVGEDRLAGLAHRVERLADRRERRLPAPGEDVEIERHRLDPVVGPRGVERAQHVAQPILARSAAAEHLARRRLGRLLDDRPVQSEEQGAAVARAEGGPGRHCRVEQSEEGDHEEQDEPVLDPDEQLPDLARELHLVALRSVSLSG